jgi:16S rRNA (cytosine967-C5)-methyltransferase
MNARQAALDVLSDVLEKRAYLNLALKQALRKDVSKEDRRFVTALASATIENLYRIDYVLAGFVTARRVHRVIQNILRLGVCQLLFFESVPESAAVNESVKLAERNGKRQLKGFVNAVLRKIAQNAGNICYPDAEADFAQYLHIMYSYPKWLCGQYIADYGEERAEAMLEYKGDNALTGVRQNGFCPGALPAHFESSRYLDDAWYIRNAGDVERMPLFQNGVITVQGEASMLCVRAAGIGRGDAVLDVCAAPGGKSMYAAWFAREGSVTAMDIHAHRVELIRQNARRLAVPNVRAVQADAAVFDPAMEELFDVVLADVPCSALGLLYRKPDIRLFKREEDSGPLISLQRSILAACARYVKSGGTLLYSTCTVNRRENEENIAWFLENHADFAPDDLKNYLPERLMRRADGGMLQLLPHIDQIDGFFMARLRKR